MNTGRQQRVVQEIIPRRLNISGESSFFWTKDKLWKENIFLVFYFWMSGSFWIVWKRNTIKEPSILQHSTIGDLSINSAPFVSSTSGGRRWKQTLYPHPSYLIIFLCRIYSRLEENDEDALYFFTKAGLGSDFELVRENVQGERGKAANVDMTHERSITQYRISSHIKVAQSII